jgi:Ca-activated chloride channel family protein
MPPTAGMADLGTAIEAASEAVRQIDGADSRKVMFVTSGRYEFNDTAQTNSIQALRRLADAHVPWQIVRIGNRQDARMTELARQGHGQAVTAASSADIYAALLGSYLSEPPIAARRVRLKIAFNPQAVTGYRLLGHEAATLTAPAADPVEADFVADQTATNVYEVWVKPGADQVATVELSWHEADNDRAHREARRLRRGQLTGSFSQAPSWLQQGVLAAKGAEALRGSYYLPATRPVGRLLELAEGIDPRVRQKADFQALHSLLKQADKSR